MKTFTPKPSDIEQKWFVIDANGQVLGRLATRIADILRGKNKPIWAPHMDCGDFVVVINADKVLLTGRKMTENAMCIIPGIPVACVIRRLAVSWRKSPNLSCVMLFVV